MELEFGLKKEEDSGKHKEGARREGEVHPRQGVLRETKAQSEEAQEVIGKAV